MNYGATPYPQHPYGQQFPPNQPQQPYGVPQRPPFPGQYMPPPQGQPFPGQQQWQPQSQAQVAQPMPMTPVPQPEPKKAEFVAFDLKVSTTDTIPGVTITEVVGPVFGVVVRARDARATPDLVGQLVAARQDALRGLVDMAQSQNADGIIGVRWETAKVSDQLAEVCAYGTAVLYTSAEQ